MRKLTSIHVTNLFGHLNHAIELEQERGITILHGANGTGKTTILRAVNQLSRSIPQFLANVKFKTIKLSFQDGASLTVRKQDNQLSLELHQGSKQLHAINTKSLFSPESQLRSLRLLQELTSRSRQPQPRQSASSALATYSDWLAGDLITSDHHESLTDLIGERLNNQNFPRWLVHFWGTFECTLIEEQRLFRISEHQTHGQQLFKRAVEDYADELRIKIKDALGSYAEHSQQLDRTFPRRVIEAFEAPPPDATELSGRLDRIEKRRQELHSAGLIEKETAFAQFDYQKLSRGEVATTLSVYATDTEAKLNKFNDIHRKITTFEGLINSHLTHKSVRVSKDKGLEFVTPDTGMTLNPAALSSGEQHMLVLFYELIFGHFKPGHLVLIDEPEISLHPAWQLRFIDDLEKVRSINKVDFILATHSPQIIGSKWALARELSV